MSKRKRDEPPQFRLAGQEGDRPRPLFAQTLRGRALLILVTVACLTLAYAPIGQFYLAWVGLAPWLVLVAHAQSRKAVLWWSWGAGALFFAANMWWLIFVTVPGAVVLVIYLGLWFAAAGLIFRAANLLDFGPERPVCKGRVTVAVLGVAAVWTAGEYLRGTLFTGLPWLFLGHTQSPVLAMCQIADFAGVYGVTFWVVLVNAWAAVWAVRRFKFDGLRPAGIAIVGLLAGVAGYGYFRINQTAQTAYPGPTVMVVQPAYPQDNSGSKGATLQDIVLFHVEQTRSAVANRRAAGQVTDLVAWSETMMPELNQAYRAARRGKLIGQVDHGEFLDGVYQLVTTLAAQSETHIVAGGSAMIPDKKEDGTDQWSRRNCAYLFDAQGRESSARYDKIHLVPFGEFIPFRESFPPLFRFFNLFNPYPSDYTVARGTELVTFEIRTGGAAASPGGRWRFVSPICFEDIDAGLVARMFRGEGAEAGRKRADLIVNLTNDGWFTANEMPQHLQAAIFRSIENRAPTARTVNTGISGFVDVVGRTHGLVKAKTEGTSTATVSLDSRYTFYTRFGDVFAWGCVVGSAVCVGAGVVRSRLKKRAGGDR